MAEVLRAVLTAGFHGGIVIIAVLLLRFLLRKAPKKYVCVLWILALLRLLLPVEIKSPLSLQPEPKILQQEIISVIPQDEQENMLDAQRDDTVQNSDRAPIFRSPQEESVELIPNVQNTGTVRFTTILPYLWCTGTAVFLLWGAISLLRLRLRVRESVRLPGFWECDRIGTAFILGVFRPRVYLPMGLREDVRNYVLIHEQMHLKNGDPWYKLAGFLALALHWYHPLVWLAYVLLCRDIELACDEEVVQGMQLQERKAYSNALLQCSAPKAYFAPSPVAFAEVSVKERIMSVLRYKKPAFWLSIAGVLAIIFVVVFLLTSPLKSGGDQTGEKETTAAETPAPEPTRPPMTEENGVYTVSTVQDFLSVIGSDREIILLAGEYRLDEVAGNGVGANCRWEQSGEEYGLVITGVENLIIRGEGIDETKILTENRTVSVLKVEDSSGVVLSDLTLGHNPTGSCNGNTVELIRSDDVYLHDMGLFGCGLVGLMAEDCSNLVVENSDIYHCSQYAAEFIRTDVTLLGCEVYDIGFADHAVQDIIVMNEAGYVKVLYCDFFDSESDTLLVGSCESVVFEGNEVYHNTFLKGLFAVESSDFSLVGNTMEENDVPQWYLPGSAFGLEGNHIVPDPLTDTASTDELTQQEEIRVGTVDEFLEAIGPNRKIVLTAENYDLSTATGYGTDRSTWWYWKTMPDGPELNIVGVNNMTICGESGDMTAHRIEVVPRYAAVLFFDTCTNITLTGFTAGHTAEPGKCSGGVLEFWDCENLTVEHCGLYGCGILGVETMCCSDVTVRTCEIYECSLGGIRMQDTYYVTLENNTFRDIGSEDTDNEMEFVSCGVVTLDGEEILDFGDLALSSEG